MTAKDFAMKRNTTKGQVTGMITLLDGIIKKNVLVHYEEEQAQKAVNALKNMLNQWDLRYESAKTINMVKAAKRDASRTSRTTRKGK